MRSISTGAAALLACYLAIPACSTVWAGLNPETGAFLFENYSENQYGISSPQNWSIARDHRGVMYFGNTSGVLEFDGATWRQIPLAGGVRGVAVDARGTIFVGRIGDFGMLKPDATGTLTFQSLLGRVPRKDRVFDDIWRILPTRDGVYFSSYKRLFRLNPDGTFKSWAPAKKFSRAFFLNNSVYVQSKGAGLMRVNARDELELVPGGEKLGDTKPGAELLQGTASLGDKHIVSTQKQLYLLEPGGLTPFATSAKSYLTENTAESIAVLGGKSIAVGTRTGGLLLLDGDGTPFRTVNSAEGYLDNVTAIYPDTQGGVWLTGFNGITHFNPGLSNFPKGGAITGNVETMIRQGDAIYAGTTEGISRIQTQTGAMPRFETLDGISKTTVWALTRHGESIFAGASNGVYLVSGKVAKVVLRTTTIWDICNSAQDADIVYVAGRPGVLQFRRNGAVWEKSAEFTPPGEEFRSILEDSDGRVWATTRGKIWRLDFRETPVKAEKYTPEGPSEDWANVRRLQGHIVFATTKGLRRYSESMKRFAPDATLGEEYANGSRDVFNIFEDTAGNVWVTGARYHDLLLKNANGYTKQPMPLVRTGINGIYWMSIDPDGTAWVTGSDFVLHRFDRALYGNPDADFRVLTRRIHDLGAAKDIYGGAGTFANVKLPWQSNALRFEFAAPFYEKPTAVQYRYRLEGNDSDWSKWGNETHKEYTHLSEGSYRFRVQALSPHGTIAEQSIIAFGILPPWYRSWWAYSIYLIFGCFGVWGIVQARTRQLREEKRKLEVIVEERTVEIREQRDEIQVQEKKSRELLLNILPVKVADELKATGSVQPVGFEDVTVCFTDFVGFTVSSEKLAPGKLVDSLNEYFTAFDEIIARYGLEKLKTIGDSYMFASGLPVQRKSHAVDAVLAAMEMVEIVKNLAAKPDGTKWGIRVGLHSGPVVAGVVGIRKFAFDIWGNTVNFAARMESSGVPGHVNMSDRTASLLHGLIDTEFRGDVKIKEGRFLPMYLAHGPATSDEATFAHLYEREFGEQVKSFPICSSGVLSEVAGR